MKLYRENIYPLSKKMVNPNTWDTLWHKYEKMTTDLPLSDAFEHLQRGLDLPGFLPCLIRLEEIYHEVKTAGVKIPLESHTIILNPTLQLYRSAWRLASLFNNKNENTPEMGEEWIIIWCDPRKKKVRVKAANNEELLALKIIAEDISISQAAKDGMITVGMVHSILRAAMQKAILIGLPSCITRGASRLMKGSTGFDPFITASTFTLQWHITHECDLHCKHCYDRSKRSPLSLIQGIQILDDLVSFCWGKNVSGHVCFTGGNPFLYEDFFPLYQAAVEHGLSTSILGNPVSREKIEHLVSIQRPQYFQVSLEGLAEHNDEIRGKGHFNSVLEFIKVLNEHRIFNSVMLTLTKKNMSQVLALAERLKVHTNGFTFNRLSRVGGGKNLQLPSNAAYMKFLDTYIEASRENPILRFKDNLINITLRQKGMKPFGGCTGHGCGAAFNFIVVLPDGETHACRKFPSPIGNIFQQNISDVYESDLAQRYRRGTDACRDCELLAVCGGCYAITHSHGLDVFTNRDPMCFWEDAGCGINST